MSTLSPTQQDLQSNGLMSFMTGGSHFAFIGTSN